MRRAGDWREDLRGETVANEIGVKDPVRRVQVVVALHRVILAAVSHREAIGGGSHRESRTAGQALGLRQDRAGAIVTERDAEDREFLFGRNSRTGKKPGTGR